MPSTAATAQTGNLDATELNATFVWATDGADTCVISVEAVTGTQDAYDDPELVIEHSHTGNVWFGDQVLRVGQQSRRIIIKAPLMRVRVTKENNDTAMRLNVSVALRKGS